MDKDLIQYTNVPMLCLMVSLILVSVIAHSTTPRIFSFHLLSYALLNVNIFGANFIFR